MSKNCTKSQKLKKIQINCTVSYISTILNGVICTKNWLHLFILRNAYISFDKNKMNTF